MVMSSIKTYCEGSAQYAPFLLNSETNLRVSIAIINLKKDPYFCGKYFFLCIYYRFSGWGRKQTCQALWFLFFFLKVRLNQYLESSQGNFTFFQRRSWFDLKYLYFFCSKPTSTDSIIIYVFISVQDII